MVKIGWVSFGRPAHRLVLCLAILFGAEIAVAHDPAGTVYFLVWLPVLALWLGEAAVYWLGRATPWHKRPFFLVSLIFVTLVSAALLLLGPKGIFEVVTRLIEVAGWN